MKNLCVCLLLVLTFLRSTFAGDAESNAAQPGTLKGVTIRSLPYVDFKNGRYEGMCIEMMDLIANKTGLKYTLYMAPDGQYGAEDETNGKIDNGMIKEVNKKLADFALADITVSESRSQYVDFTEPFIENVELAALISRRNAYGVCTLEDLVKNDQVAGVTFGSISTGFTYVYLGKSKDYVGLRLYLIMSHNPDAMVDSHAEGLNKVRSLKYAFLAESTYAEYVAGRNCNLTILRDNRGLHTRSYAIALPKGSKHLAAFNRAIKELKADKVIENLQKKYWQNTCNKSLYSCQ